MLIVEGAVDDDKSENAKKFKEAVFSGPLSDVNKSTTNIEIEVKMGLGKPFQTITNVTDIYTETL